MNHRSPSNREVTRTEQQINNGLEDLYLRLQFSDSSIYGMFSQENLNSAVSSPSIPYTKIDLNYTLASPLKNMATEVGATSTTAITEGEQTGYFSPLIDFVPTIPQLSGDLSYSSISDTSASTVKTEIFSPTPGRSTQICDSHISAEISEEDINKAFSDIFVDRNFQDIHISNSERPYLINENNQDKIAGHHHQFPDQQQLIESSAFLQSPPPYNLSSSCSSVSSSPVIPNAKSKCSNLHRTKKTGSSSKSNPKNCHVCHKLIHRDMLRHLRTHEPVSRFRCMFPHQFCRHRTGQFNRQYDFKKHLLNAHFKFDDPNIKKLYNLNEKLPHIGTCSCGLKFKALVWLEYHILTDDVNSRCPYISNTGSLPHDHI
ncbi:hypothetical protein PACTADRAFT_48911 [Pachysolen tannophilus NRRL Y-2460]|uniref:Uncharacterized protein n=1 Tax=Pachysolen tannophilus NRRL Y-2460 TaxID=669874 RepID=A0A1E4TZI3_PACTA|nr:hypothetical protein PACTADRAFT_48911 [Pachysolen tannophilus NRRL Y-2460]